MDTYKPDFTKISKEGMQNIYETIISAEMNLPKGNMLDGKRWLDHKNNGIYLEGDESEFLNYGSLLLSLAGQKSTGLVEELFRRQEEILKNKLKENENAKSIPANADRISDVAYAEFKNAKQEWYAINSRENANPASMADSAVKMLESLDYARLAAFRPADYFSIEDVVVDNSFSRSKGWAIHFM